MAYESFYGGRQGASFRIVKEYASIADMVAEFKQGGATVDQVNYGEYVLIRASINDPDNGKLYYRGMDYNNDLGGAEYIGQIVGPEGRIKNLEVGAYDPTAASKEGGIGEYVLQEEEPGLVPGSENDAISYSWANIKDAETGYIEKYLIGFKFPYFQQDQQTESISPYNLPQNLIEDITDPDIEHHPNGRPFYREYLMKIPKGIKGDSIDKVTSMPVIIKAGSTIYLTVSSQSILSDVDRVLEEDLPISVGSFIDYDITKTKNYVQQKENEVFKYAYLTSADKWHTGYSVRKFDESAEGIITQFDAGINNYIEEMVITANDFSSKSGFLLVYYSDPTIRKSIPLDKKASYRGKDDQYNLGHVEGKPGGTPLLGRINSLDDLYDANHVPIKPEDLGNNPDYRGQVVSLDVGAESDQIQAYDYLNTNDWYCVGYLGGGSGNGFVISNTVPELTIGGVQGYVELINCQ